MKCELIHLCLNNDYLLSFLLDIPNGHWCWINDDKTCSFTFILGNTPEFFRHLNNAIAVVLYSYVHLKNKFSAHKCSRSATFKGFVKKSKVHCIVFLNYRNLFHGNDCNMCVVLYILHYIYCIYIFTSIYSSKKIFNWSIIHNLWNCKLNTIYINFVTRSTVYM